MVALSSCRIAYQERVYLDFFPYLPIYSILIVLNLQAKPKVRTHEIPHPRSRLPKPIIRTGSIQGKRDAQLLRNSLYFCLKDDHFLGFGAGGRRETTLIGEDDDVVTLGGKSAEFGHNGRTPPFPVVAIDGVQAVGFG